MKKGIFSTFLLEDEPQANEWLQERGVPESIGDLYHNAGLNPGCAVELLELFKSPFSFNVRVAVARALFARRPGAELKPEAVEVLLRLIKDNPGRSAALSSLILNELANNVSRDKVQEVGEMALDARYGPLRVELVHALGGIRDTAVIPYLLRAAREPATIGPALDQLAQRRVDDALELCEQALNNPKLDETTKEYIGETRAKIIRRLAKSKKGKTKE